MNGREIVSVEEAGRRILAFLTGLRDSMGPRLESVPLAEAQGRVLSADAQVASPVPPFDLSRVDGYGVGCSEESAAADGRFSVVGSLFAGSQVSLSVGPREAVRIMSGAPIPPGVDLVVPFEEVVGIYPGSRDAEGGAVVLGPLPLKGTNIFRAGSQAAIGQVLYRKGFELSPEAIGRLATGGLLNVPVYRRPSLGVLATGSELSPPGQPLPPGKIYNSNLLMFQALAQAWSIQAVPGCPAADNVPELAMALSALLEGADCVVATGGVAGGDRDLMRAALDMLKATILVEEVDVHPGGRIVIGSIADKLVFGLSGSPGAALTAAVLLLRPALRYMEGRPSLAPLTAKLRAEVDVPPGPRRAFPVALTWDGPLLTADLVARHGWHESACDRAPGLWLAAPGAGRLDAGTEVPVFPVQGL